MAVKFFGIIKDLKNISVSLTNGNSKKQRITDEQDTIIPVNSFNNLNNCSSNNSEKYCSVKYYKQSTSSRSNCSENSSIDSGNSSITSYDSHNFTNGRNENGSSKLFNVDSSQSLQKETSCIQEEDLNSSKLNDINLGPSEKLHVKPTDFEFLKVIGHGSFGRVLLARHKKEQKVYAVKVLQKKMIIKRNEKNHIMCERNVLLKNLNHPFLVGLHYSFQTRDKLYFILDYINGGELFFHLQKEHRFSEPRAKFYAAEICSALGYLHSNCIIYRDLKPENILLDREGHICLTDFGLCKDGIRQRDTTGTFCGTIEYLAPEIIKKEPYDWAVDWWCLGAVLYEMLNGLPPFYRNDFSEMIYDIINRPVNLRTNISISAKNIIKELLHKDKNLRLGSKDDVEEIKNHEFFRSINWSDLESKKVPPPFNPNVKGALDFKNIDPEFIKEPIPNSLCKSASIGTSSIPENAFQGFSYAAPQII